MLLLHQLQLQHSDLLLHLINASIVQHHCFAPVDLRIFREQWIFQLFQLHITRHLFLDSRQIHLFGAFDQFALLRLTCLVHILGIFKSLQVQELRLSFNIPFAEILSRLQASRKL